MGLLTDDMARLRGEVNFLRDERMILAKSIKEDTQNRKDATMAMREQFRNAHLTMAESSKRDRMAWFSGLKSNIVSLKEGFYRDFAAVRHTLAEMAANTQKTNADFVTSMKSDVSQLREGFRLAHTTMADKSQADRMAFLAGLKADVSKMQEGFSKNRQEVARAGRSSRAAALSALRAEVSHLMTDAQNIREEDRKLFAGMVREARASRSEFVDGLKKSVDTLRSKYLDDISGAHAAWFSLPQGTIHIESKATPQAPIRTEFKSVKAEQPVEEKERHYPETTPEFQPVAEPERQPVMMVEEQKVETEAHHGGDEPSEPRTKEERKASKRDKHR